MQDKALSEEAKSMLAASETQVKTLQEKLQKARTVGRDRNR